MEEKILNLLKAHGPIFSKDLAKKAGKYNTKDIQKTLNKLYKDGAITKEKIGRQLEWSLTTTIITEQSEKDLIGDRETMTDPTSLESNWVIP